ncbi:MAG TPA: hypothetical protein VGK64_27835 [Bryobacteraceae bacterium]
MHINNAVNDEGLTVIDAASPSFMAEVQQFLDAEALEKAASFLPYSLIIVNNTGRYVWDSP